jgi:BirA family biotin operon repressor/biotin-[acetyl-CoA-carboxylase] ligase
MPIGHPLIHLGTTTSTMDEVARFADEGAPEGLVVVADEQTAGRGRVGRTWISRPGSGLYCSILLRPTVLPSRLAVLPLTVGVAVAEAVESTAQVACQLKWPNDVWIGGRKVAGILTTAKSSGEVVDSVVLGIGVNVSAEAKDLPPGATSVLAASGRSIAPMELLPVLIDRLNTRLPPILHSSIPPDLDGWRRRAALMGVSVAILDGGKTFHGVMRGVDDAGALLLESDGTLRRVVAGELTRGPTKC